MGLVGCGKLTFDLAGICVVIDRMSLIMAGYVRIGPGEKDCGCDRVLGGACIW